MESEIKKKKKRKSREHDINEDEVVHKVPNSGNKLRKTKDEESVDEESESYHPKAKKKKKHVDTNRTVELETDHLREENREKERELEEDNSHKKKKKKEKKKKLLSDSEMVVSSNRNTDKNSSVTKINTKANTGSNKSATENKLMKKLADLTGKSLAGVKHKHNTNTVSQGLPEESVTKKTKNVFKMEDADKVEGEVDEEIDPEKEAIRKKKREKRRLKKLEKQRKKEEELARFGTGKDSARAYLRQWDTDRDNWRFQKVRQVWLLQNMFNESFIDDELFEILLRYLEPLKGNSREATVKTAEKVMEDLEKDEDKEDPVKERRAKLVIQLLS